MPKRCPARRSAPNSTESLVLPELFYSCSVIESQPFLTGFSGGSQILVVPQPAILERSEVDVLLADVAMPDEDGYTLIRKVRASTAGRIAAIPAAAVTTHARDDGRRQALSAGFHLHLAKPVEIAALTRTVQALVRGSSLVH